METNRDLLQVIQSVGLEYNSTSVIQQTLHENFMPFITQAEEWKQKASELVVTDISQVTEMKLAREARLALKEIRINADKKRVELKEDSLKYGKAVQGVYNFIEGKIKPIEKYLEEQEKFVEIQESKRKAELKAIRQEKLNPYMMFVPYGLDLGELSEEDFEKAYNGAKLQMEAKIEAQRKAEEDRIAKEKAESEERERIRIENEKLKAQAQANEKALAEQRAKAEAERKEIEEKAKKQKAEIEAKLKKEKDEKKRVEAELELVKKQNQAKKEPIVASKVGQKDMASQFLIKKLKNDIGRNNAENDYQAGYKQCLIEILNYVSVQTLEMEKNNILEAFNEGQEYEYQYHINSAPKFDSETYFVETYKGGEQ